MAESSFSTFATVGYEGPETETEPAYRFAILFGAPTMHQPLFNGGQPGDALPVADPLDSVLFHQHALVGASRSIVSRAMRRVRLNREPLLDANAALGDRLEALRLA